MIRSNWTRSEIHKYKFFLERPNYSITIHLSCPLRREVIEANTRVILAESVYVIRGKDTCACVCVKVEKKPVHVRLVTGLKLARWLSVRQEVFSNIPFTYQRTHFTRTSRTRTYARTRARPRYSSRRLPKRERTSVPPVINPPLPASSACFGAARTSKGGCAAT